MYCINGRGGAVHPSYMEARINCPDPELTTAPWPMVGTYTCLYRDLQRDVTLLLHARFTT